MSMMITMPALSPTMEKGTLARWLVAAGDRVSIGSALAEIETDKATMEWEAADEGFVGELLIAEGSEDVPVGTPILRLTGAREASSDTPGAVSNLVSPSTKPVATVRNVGGTLATLVSPSPAAALSPVALPHGVGATPLALRLAAGAGIDLTRVAGTGPDGRIRSSDLSVAFARHDPVSLPRADASIPSPPVALVNDIPHEEVRLSAMQKVVARRLTESKQQVPHFYMSVDARLDQLLALRRDLNEALAGKSVALSINDMMIKVLATALYRVPAAHVQFAGDTLLRFNRADIAVAVAVEGGLLTPVVRDAGRRSLSAIALEMKTLAARARSGELKPEEYRGGTASLSNLGMYGIERFDPVINPPQALILGVGAGKEQVVPDGPDPIIATVLTLTGSFDHRAINGAVAAEFMSVLRELIEAPMAGLA